MTVYNVRQPASAMSGIFAVPCTPCEIFDGPTHEYPVEQRLPPACILFVCLEVHSCDIMRSVFGKTLTYAILRAATGNGCGHAEDAPVRQYPPSKGTCVTDLA